MIVNTVLRGIQRTLLTARRIHRAWRFHRQLHYTWHLAWHKAGWQA